MISDNQMRLCSFNRCFARSRPFCAGQRCCVSHPLRGQRCPDSDTRLVDGLVNEQTCIRLLCRCVCVDKTTGGEAPITQAASIPCNDKHAFELLRLLQLWAQSMHPTSSQFYPWMGMTCLRRLCAFSSRWPQCVMPSLADVQKTHSEHTRNLAKHSHQSLPLHLADPCHTNYR